MEYYPEFFNSDSFEESKFIVLCSNEYDYNYRWESETAWIKDVLVSTRCIDENSIVLDWGTGVGRLAKMLIETFNCKVIGVDISPTMLRHAVNYVNNTDKFVPVHYNQFMEAEVKNQYTCCIATWVLQHSATSAFDIQKIQEALVSNGNMFVLEMSKKCVIAKQNGTTISVDDGVDNKTELQKYFQPLMLGKLPRKITVEPIFNDSWWGFLEKM